MENTSPLFRQWMGFGILLLISLVSLFSFYYSIDTLINQLNSKPPVISFLSIEFTSLGFGLFSLSIMLSLLLENILKWELPDLLSSILGKIIATSMLLILLLPLIIYLLITPYLGTIQYTNCNLPNNELMDEFLSQPTVYTNNPKSCLDLLKVECAKPGRFYKPCIEIGMIFYGGNIQHER